MRRRAGTRADGRRPANHRVLRGKEEKRSIRDLHLVCLLLMASARASLRYLCMDVRAVRPMLGALRLEKQRGSLRLSPRR